MLNISNNRIDPRGELLKYPSFRKSYESSSYKTLNRLITGFSIFSVLFLFLPWTQNIGGKGYVTTLVPDERPQTVQSPIPGRVEKWFVTEGQLVKKGDTLMHISDIKNEYLDPNLVMRTQKQLDAKKNSLIAYENKIVAYENQLVALKENKEIKINQTKNKIIQNRLKLKADSNDFAAAKIKLDIAVTQFNRTKSLFDEGIKSKNDLELKDQKRQESQAKYTSTLNKYEQNKNQLINNTMEVGRVRSEYNDKIAKIESEKFTAIAAKFETENMIQKLENSLSNYQVRSGMYDIKAPQSGFIKKAIVTGIGETIKSGQELLSIMPKQFKLAVEAYIDPMDMPLVHTGEEVRIQFDGWPAIFFNGWPNASYGTFSGEIVAIQDFISENNRFRILIAPIEGDKHAWPANVKVGGGAETIALLNDVPIWYELWRNLNGFPPNYYTPEIGNNNANDKKKSKEKEK